MSLGPHGVGRVDMSKIKMRPNIAFVHLPSTPLSEVERLMEGRSQGNLRDVTFVVTMPLGLLYLSSYVKAFNEVGKIGLIDYPAELVRNVTDYASVDELIDHTARTHIDFIPDIIAISSVFSVSHRFLMRTAQALKLMWPNAVVVVGGTHPTNTTRLVLENPAVDYVCRGEGEYAFSQFIKAFGTPEQDRIPGFYTRDNIGSGAYATVAPQVDDLDGLPLPDWDLIDMELYIVETAKGMARHGGRYRENPSALIMTTRGCSFRCTFCSSHTVHSRKVRFRSVDNVMNEVFELNRRYGVTTIIPEDDLFTANAKKVIELLEAFQKVTIPNFQIQFPNALSVNTLHDEVMDNLIQAGMPVAQIAIESGAAYTQRHIIKKNVNLDKARHVVRYMRDRNITARCNFLLGFPGETKELMQETLDYAKNLKADWCTFGVVVPLIGSEMYSQFVEMGYIEDDPEKHSDVLYFHRAFDTKEISAQELEDFAYRVNLEVNFVNNVNFAEEKFAKAVEIFSDIVMKYPFHIFGLHCLRRAYLGLDNVAKADETWQRLEDIVQTDTRAREMIEKFAYLVPELLELRDRVMAEPLPT